MKTIKRKIIKKMKREEILEKSNKKIKRENKIFFKKSKEEIKKTYKEIQKRMKNVATNLPKLIEGYRDLLSSKFKENSEEIN